MKVFISYKWEDQDHNAWVERLASDLFNNGIDPLLDKWEIRFGESLSDYMTRGINTADAMLFIMTPKSIEAAEKAASKGGAVQFEVRSGLSRLLDGKGDFRLIGLLRRGDDPVVHLRDSLYVDFRDDDSYETSLRQLVADLKGFTKKHPTVTELSQKPRPEAKRQPLYRVRREVALARVKENLGKVLTQASLDQIVAQLPEDRANPEADRLLTEIETLDGTENSQRRLLGFLLKQSRVVSVPPLPNPTQASRPKREENKGEKSRTFNGPSIRVESLPQPSPTRLSQISKQSKLSHSRSAASLRWSARVLGIGIFFIALIGTWIKVRIYHQLNQVETLINDLHMAELWDLPQDIADSKGRTAALSIGLAQGSEKDMLKKFDVAYRDDGYYLTLETQDDQFLQEEWIAKDQEIFYLSGEFRQMAGPMRAAACLLFLGNRGFCLSGQGYTFVALDDKAPGQPNHWHWRQLGSWVPTAALHSSPEIPNKLTIISQPKFLELFVNNTKVYRVDELSPTIRSLDQVGVGIFLEKPDAATFKLKNLEIRK